MTTTSGPYVACVGLRAPLNVTDRLIAVARDLAADPGPDLVALLRERAAAADPVLALLWAASLHDPDRLDRKLLHVADAAVCAEAGDSPDELGCRLTELLDALADTVPGGLRDLLDEDPA